MAVVAFYGGPVRGCKLLEVPESLSRRNRVAACKLSDILSNLV
jgi:hypothetical protein